jgi:RNA polymerase sigma-70 factor (ECF subfamily)
MVGTVIWRATGDESSIEDLAQETFLRVFRALAYYDSRAKLSTWIYTIAHRVAIDHLRKSGRWLQIGFTINDDDGDMLDRAADGTVNPETAVAQKELDELVRDGLARIPDKYRIPLVYAAIDGLDYETIAAMLGIPVGTVKTFIFRGKHMLKEQIQEDVDGL